ncbi:MAG TPA: enoyl-CoA hydratase-related protein [Steroidobacteraceae bacterium]
MNTSKHVRIERISSLLAITLARPEKKNALTGEMYQVLWQALELASAEASIQVVLVDADGADFCAGNDIADFVALARSEQTLENSDVYRFLRALALFEKPLVAAVRGRAVGVGLTMLLHCDLVYVADNTRLSAPFVDLALVPEAAASLLLPARIGHVRAFALFALGEALDGRAAVDCGLANAAVAADEVTPRARAAALALAEKPALALQATKKLMRDHARMLAVIESEGREFAQRLVSAEAQATFRAFMRRRGTGS